MRTQLVVASTAFGLATVTAVHRSGLLRGADRQVLVCSSTSAVPEVATGLLEVSGAAGQAAAFDAVVDLNAVLAPLHPAGWAPREVDLPVWERYLRRAWDLGDGEVDLLVESVQADPALALCRVFADARVDVYADGLMSYGPTRVALPDAVGARVERLLHPDLAPGLEPLLLREFDVPATLIPTPALVRATGGDRRAAPAGTEPVALLLGQYLAAAGLLTLAEETDLYAAMVDGAVAAGHRLLEFKPHPSAPAGQAAGLRRVAERAGATLTVLGGDELAEARFARGGVALVVGCFSTALATARCFGLRTASVGTALVLQRLAPYENSNRIPATIVSATVPELDSLAGCSDDRSPPGPALALPDLVRCVGYCMQPDRNHDLRPDAVRVLREHPDELRRYVKRRRLTSLDLPGRGVRRTPVATVVRRAVRLVDPLRRSAAPARPARR